MLFSHHMWCCWQQQQAGTKTQKSFLHKRCTLNGGFEDKKTKQLMIHKVTCKVFSLAKWNMPKTLSSDQASMAQLTSLSDLNATYWVQYSNRLSPITQLSICLHRFALQLKFAWLCCCCSNDEVYIRVGRIWESRRELAPVLRLVLTMKKGRVSTIGDISIDMCPLYEGNPDWKPSSKKTWKKLKIVA